MAETKCEYCDYHALCKDKIESHDCEIKDLDNRVTETEKSLAVYNVELTNAVKDIALYMKDMNKTVNKIEQGTTQNSSDIQMLTNKFDQRDRDFEEMEKLKTRVDGIDKESMVNTRTWLRDNFAKLAIIVAIGTIVFTGIATYIINNIIK